MLNRFPEDAVLGHESLAAIIDKTEAASVSIRRDGEMHNENLDL